MWYECGECSYAGNSPRAAANHCIETGHLVRQEIDWTDNEEIV